MFKWDGYNCETMMDESGLAVIFSNPATTHCRCEKPNFLVRKYDKEETL